MLTVRSSILAALIVAMLAAWLTPWTVSEGAPSARAGGGPDLLRRASMGDEGALREIETRLDPLFARKDLWTLGAAEVRRESARLLGVAPGEDLIGWASPAGATDAIRTLTLDFGEMLGASPGPAFVSYGVVDRSAASEVRVSWYHDLGKRLSEQGNRGWHPVDVTFISARSGAGGRSLLFSEAARPAGPAVGILVLQEREGTWSAGARLAPAADARLVAIGPGGAVFEAPRDPPAGVLSGAPAGMFRSLVVYELTGGLLQTEPLTAPVPDPVSAAEALLESLREGDLEGVRRRCASPDVLGALQYFSPGWKGGGRVVSASRTDLEFVYEERGRPTLRLHFRFVRGAGSLLLESATGRSESEPG